MTITDSIKLSVSSIRSGILRTLLSVLSLAVGVGAVLTVLALGDAGEVRVEDEIAKLGVNKVWIRASSNNNTLKAQDARLISEAVQAPACAGAYTMANVAFGRQSALIQIAGFDASAVSVHAPKVLEGRMLNAGDFDRNNVCLIDEVLSEYLGGDMLGEYVRVANRRIRVVGIIKPMSMQTLSGGNGMMIVPLATVLDAIGGEIAEITVSVQPGQETHIVAAKAMEMLGEDGFRTDTLEEEINAAREIVRIFVMVLLCVALVCMLSGGIGVMNVLLMAVRDRKNEIGLIKAIGGTAGQIALLFLLEATAYALLGGLLGVLLGQGMIVLFGAVIGLEATAGLNTVIPVMFSAAVIGVISGVAPAVKASSLQPVEALKND